MTVEVEVYLILNDHTWTTSWWRINADDEDQQYVEWNSFDGKFDETGVIQSAVAHREESLLDCGLLADDIEHIAVKYWHIVEEVEANE